MKYFEKKVLQDYCKNYSKHKSILTKSRNIMIFMSELNTFMIFLKRCRIFDQYKELMVLPEILEKLETDVIKKTWTLFQEFHNTIRH